MKKISLHFRKKTSTVWYYGSSAFTRTFVKLKRARSTGQTNQKTLLKSETCFKRHENLITTIWITLFFNSSLREACTPCHTWTITNTDPTAGWTASTTTCHGKLILRWRKRTERKAGYQCGYLVFLWHSPHDLFTASSTITLLQRRVAMTTRCHSLGGD